MRIKELQNEHTKSTNHVQTLSKSSNELLKSNRDILAKLKELTEKLNSKDKEIADMHDNLCSQKNRLVELE